MPSPGGKTIGILPEEMSQKWFAQYGKIWPRWWYEILVFVIS